MSAVTLNDQFDRLLGARRGLGGILSSRARSELDDALAGARIAQALATWRSLPEGAERESYAGPLAAACARRVADAYAEPLRLACHALALRTGYAEHIVRAANRVQGTLHVYGGDDLASTADAIAVACGRRLVIWERTVRGDWRSPAPTLAGNPVTRCPGCASAAAQFPDDHADRRYWPPLPQPARRNTLAGASLAARRALSSASDPTALLVEPAAAYRRAALAELVGHLTWNPRLALRRIFCDPSSPQPTVIDAVNNSYKPLPQAMLATLAELQDAPTELRERIWTVLAEQLLLWAPPQGSEYRHKDFEQARLRVAGGLQSALARTLTDPAATFGHPWPAGLSPDPASLLSLRATRGPVVAVRAVRHGDFLAAEGRPHAGRGVRFELYLKDVGVNERHPLGLLIESPERAKLRRDAQSGGHIVGFGHLSGGEHLDAGELAKLRAFIASQR